MKKHFWISLFLLVCMAAVVLWYSCQRPVNTSKPKSSGYVQADLSLLLNNQNAMRQQKTITDPVELQRLIAFFPELGQGEHSHQAGSWIASVTIELKHSDGTWSRIKADTGWEYWSEGYGDWPLSPAFHQYIQTLFASSSMQIPITGPKTKATAIPGNEVEVTKSQCAENLKLIATALRQYANANNISFPTAQIPTTQPAKSEPATR
jgi:hypothetical protein